MSLSFTNPRDPENRALRAKIEEWLRESELLRGDERLIAVVEESDRCGPNCPHTETVLRIAQDGDVAGDELRANEAAGGDAQTSEASGARRELRIMKPLVFVRRADVRALSAT